MTYDDLIDEVMLLFSQNKYENEVASAKNEFHRAAGIFDEESIDVENKINLFMDWYLFHRPLSLDGVRPIDKICKGEIKPNLEIPDDRLKSFCSSRHSLFEFIKVKGEDVYVKDLFSNYKTVLKKSPVTLGFSKSEIFSARLFALNDTFVFSKAFCIHPEQACKYILKEVKKIKKLSDEERDQKRFDLIFRLLKMRYKIDQYKHIKLEEIYTDEPKLRI
ncbi:MAG: hypothetical protein KDD58_03720 [Bdellovibrionales bacterium]|nr:hypothetical protein [Bdellovibrionales bacterium]